MHTQRQSDADRTLPMNPERAATALIQSRRRLEEAEAQMRIAATILDGSELIDVSDERLHRLVDAICLLEASERALEEAWTFGE